MQGWVSRLRGLLLAVLRQGLALRLPQTAASLAFLSTLAVVPIFSIVISVMAALPVFERLRDTLQRFLRANLFLPSIADTVLGYVNQFASRASELSLLGALVFFATAFSALLTIERALNQIWAADRPRSLARRITLYWTLLTLGPLVLAFSLTINGIVFSDWLAGLTGRGVWRAWFTALPIVMAVGVLTLLYRLVPNVPVRWRDALLGALLAALILQGLRSWLGAYVARMPGYTVVYGAFAALPLFLLWLFTTWLTVLLGALLAANLRYWGSGSQVHLHWAPAQRFEAAARVLGALAAAQRAGLPLVAAGDLRRELGPDTRRAEEVAGLLAGLGYLHRHWLMQPDQPRRDPERAVWDEHWSLARPASALTMRWLFEAVWNGREGANGRGRRDPSRVRDPALRIDGPMLDEALSVRAESSALTPGRTTASPASG